MFALDLIYEKTTYFYYLFPFQLSGFHKKIFQQMESRDKNHNSHAFINATIHVDAETIVNEGYLFIKEGRIAYVGGKNEAP